ncbi:PREDICTED: uncharacterized protein LOC108567745 [Nicrophorus vespilloides]|uniref:Uncharacterized protein LOC108567745 n=1 Tax=Nicrophorus vespilloides TaxID=110193 RepID=A0ABM1NAM4_NICVS|nr:PREDICTED: uncharacterized protein LOC108567745 [Nicrophorus vespilloides]
MIAYRSASSTYPPFEHESNLVDYNDHYSRINNLDNIVFYQRSNNPSMCYALSENVQQSLRRAIINQRQESASTTSTTDNPLLYQSRYDDDSRPGNITMPMNQIGESPDDSTDSEESSSILLTPLSRTQNNGSETIDIFQGIYSNENGPDNQIVITVQGFTDNSDEARSRRTFWSNARHPYGKSMENYIRNRNRQQASSSSGNHRYDNQEPTSSEFENVYGDKRMPRKFSDTLPRHLRPCESSDSSDDDT